MTDPMHDDDNPPPKPRWIGWVIIIGMALAALGVLNIGWRIFQGPPAATAAVQRPDAAPQLLNQELLAQVQPGLEAKKA